MPMRIMGLDVGDERIGVALSDETALLASPLDVIARVPGSASFHRLAGIIRAHAVERIVVGLPLLPDGSEGKQVASTRAYLRGLTRYVDVPVVLWDERYTSVEAEEIAARNRPRRRQLGRRARPVDHIAAAVILQEYLDHFRGGSSL